MPIQLVVVSMSIRSLIFCAFCSTILGFLVTFVCVKGYRASSGNYLNATSESKNERVETDKDYLAEPGDFYLNRQEMVHLNFSADREPQAIEIELENVLPILILNDADLLADQSMADFSQFVSPEQLFQAKKLTKNRYDLALKELRRKRSEIMEKLGTGSDDADKELEKVRIQTWELMNEVRANVLREVFTFEEREQIYTFFNERKERADAARAAATHETERSNKVPDAGEQ